MDGLKARVKWESQSPGERIMAQFQAGSKGSLHLHEAHPEIQINMAVVASSALKDPLYQHVHPFPSHCVSCSELTGAPNIQKIVLG